jgi:hypothetical protein
MGSGGSAVEKSDSLIGKKEGEIEGKNKEEALDIIEEEQGGIVIVRYHSVEDPRRPVGPKRIRSGEGYD